jgi:hypothetical protein
MATVYHVGRDGSARACTAKIKCRLGGLHSADKAEVAKAGEAMIAAEMKAAKERKINQGVWVARNLEERSKLAKVAEASPEFFADFAVGNTITSVDEETGAMTLSDGRTLYLRENGDGSSLFQVQSIQVFDGNSAITDVVFTETEHDDGQPAPSPRSNLPWNIPPVKQVYSFKSGDKEVARVEVNGDYGSGFYEKTIELAVSKVGRTLDTDFKGFSTVGSREPLTP